MNDFNVRLNEDIEIINKALDGYMGELLDHCGEQKIAVEAMAYSLSAGGKRIRPVLVMEFCRMCGGNVDNAVSAGCALEMIHTFSLIHDDLPCMDDDAFRRGKPSCHAAYGKVNALLAGDALEDYAFEVLCSSKLSSGVKVKLVQALSRETGMLGMTGGQVIDTSYENKPISRELLLKMYKMKTGALLKAACKMGCICAEKDEYIPAAESYAENLGLAFQIIDDILDITGNESELGKPIGSDAENGKITFASLEGVSASQKFAAELTENALSALKSFENADFLKNLTVTLLGRRS